MRGNLACGQGFQRNTVNIHKRHRMGANPIMGTNRVPVVEKPAAVLHLPRDPLASETVCRGCETLLFFLSQRQIYLHCVASPFGKHRVLGANAVCLPGVRHKQYSAVTKRKKKKNKVLRCTSWETNKQKKKNTKHAKHMLHIYMKPQPLSGLQIKPRMYQCRPLWT